MRWRRRVDLACLLGNGIESAWLATGQHGGYDFVPLLTLDDFLDESRSMHNCLDQYADRLATGLIRIFSIRQGGIPVADIEIGPTPVKAETPSIVQIKARNNRQAPLAVWQAAHHWLENQDLASFAATPRRHSHDQAHPHHRARSGSRTWTGCRSAVVPNSKSAFSVRAGDPPAVISPTPPLMLAAWHGGPPVLPDSARATASRSKDRRSATDIRISSPLTGMSSCQNRLGSAS